MCAGQLDLQCHPFSILLYGLYLTKEQHPGVFFAISVLLAGHLLFSKSLAREQRGPAAPCVRERQDVSIARQPLPYGS